jgi:hypothetical protein
MTRQIASLKHVRVVHGAVIHEFSCSLCAYQTELMGNIRPHMKETHGIFMQLLCNYCSDALLTKAGMIGHLKRMHSICLEVKAEDNAKQQHYRQVVRENSSNHNETDQEIVIECTLKDVARKNQQIDSEAVMCIKEESYELHNYSSNTVDEEPDHVPADEAMKPPRLEINTGIPAQRANQETEHIGTSCNIFTSLAKSMTMKMSKGPITIQVPMTIMGMQRQKYG